MAKQTTTKKNAVKKVPAPAPVVTKKVATPKPAAKKAVAAKKTAIRKSTPTAAVSTAPVTTIIAKYDAGFGNSLFIRGCCAGLNWDTGTVLQNKSADEWIWSSKSVTSPLEFKLLLNDQIWSCGENATVAPGKTIVLQPVF